MLLQVDPPSEEYSSFTLAIEERDFVPYVKTDFPFFATEMFDDNFLFALPVIWVSEVLASVELTIIEFVIQVIVVPEPEKNFSLPFGLVSLRVCSGKIENKLSLTS